MFDLETIFGDPPISMNRVAATPDTRSRTTKSIAGCPKCGSTRQISGWHSLWCEDCETRLGPTLIAHDAERKKDVELEPLSEFGEDGWPIDTQAQPGRCPTCRGLNFWFSLAGASYCATCDPPTATVRLLERVQRIRRNQGLAVPSKAVARAVGWKAFTDAC